MSDHRPEVSEKSEILSKGEVDRERVKRSTGVGRINERMEKKTKRVNVGEKKEGKMVDGEERRREREERKKKKKKRRKGKERKRARQTGGGERERESGDGGLDRV